MWYNPCNGPPWLVGGLLSCADSIMYTYGQEAGGRKMTPWHFFTNLGKTSYSCILILQWLCIIGGKSAPAPPISKLVSAIVYVFPCSVALAQDPKLQTFRKTGELWRGKHQMWAQSSFPHHIPVLQTSPCLWWPHLVCGDLTWPVVHQPWDAGEYLSWRAWPGASQCRPLSACNMGPCSKDESFVSSWHPLNSSKLY